MADSNTALMGQDMASQFPVSAQAVQGRRQTMPASRRRCLFRRMSETTPAPNLNKRCLLGETPEQASTKSKRHQE